MMVIFTKLTLVRNVIKWIWTSTDEEVTCTLDITYMITLRELNNALVKMI
jgi:hypothetical protein